MMLAMVMCDQGRIIDDFRLLGEVDRIESRANPALNSN